MLVPLEARILGLIPEVSCALPRADVQRPLDPSNDGNLMPYQLHRQVVQRFVIDLSTTP